MANKPKDKEDIKVSSIIAEYKAINVEVARLRNILNDVEESKLDKTLTEHTRSYKYSHLIGQIQCSLRVVLAHSSRVDSFSTLPLYAQLLLNESSKLLKYVSNLNDSVDKEITLDEANIYIFNTLYLEFIEMIKSSMNTFKQTLN